MSFELFIPAVYFDALVADGGGDRIRLVNLDPEPNEADVAIDTSIAFHALDLVGADLSLSYTQVWVDGALAYDGGAGGFQSGFTGSVSVHLSGFAFNIVKVAAFAGLTVTVRVVTATSDLGASLDTTYTFTLEDVLAPSIVAVSARTPRVVRVAWDDDVQQADASATNDALNPLNYLVLAQGAPAYEPAVASVASVNSTTVDLTFASELTFGMVYMLVVTDVEDTDGNAVEAPTNAALFTAVTPAAPAGRDFDLYSMMPAINRAEDRFGTGDMLRFLSCLQEVVNVLLYDLDSYSDILDPDTAPEEFLDAMLADLGNPFPFDLTEVDKRRLVRVLLAIYGQTGTAPGIANVVRFFMGIDIDFVPFTVDAMYLGESYLGDDWVLGPDGRWARYAFDVDCPVTLTDEQRARMTDIVNFMKPAHTHFVRLLEPTTPEVIEHVELGLSDLGDTWELH